MLDAFGWTGMNNDDQHVVVCIGLQELQGSEGPYEILTAEADERDQSCPQPAHALRHEKTSGGGGPNSPG